MRYVNKILRLIFFVSFMLLSFNACSDNASFTNKSSNNAPQRIAVDVNCSTPAIIEDYITLESNDTLSKELNNTSVIIYHDTNGIKKVCLKSGKAAIIRKNTEESK